MAPEIALAPFADGTVAFEDQTQPIEAFMASRAALVFTMPDQGFAQCPLAQSSFVGRQFGNLGRRWRNLFAQQTAHYPIPTLHRAGPQTRRILRQKDRHGQESAPR